MTHRQRGSFAAAAVFAAASIGLAAPAWAATRTVHVGRGGFQFVDDVSGTNITTINVDDTVTWVWEGSMEHSVTSGTCDHSGGGGGGGYGYGPYGGGSCDDSHEWESSGLHGGSYSFSQTFHTAGTFSYYCAMHLNAMTGKVIVQAAPAANSPCTPGEHTLCLNGNRFSATAHWTRPDGSNGDGTAVPLTDDSGYFWFFDSTNIEAVTKVLNGCAIDNAYWVFAAGLTNVAVHLTVTDTQTGAVYTRDNAQGSAFQPIQDISAFPASCP